MGQKEKLTIEKLIKTSIFIHSFVGVLYSLDYSKKYPTQRIEVGKGSGLRDQILFFIEKNLRGKKY